MEDVLIGCPVAWKLSVYNTSTAAVGLQSYLCTSNMYISCCWQQHMVTIAKSIISRCKMSFVASFVSNCITKRVLTSFESGDLGEVLFLCVHIGRIRIFSSLLLKPSWVWCNLATCMYMTLYVRHLLLLCWCAVQMLWCCLWSGLADKQRIPQLHQGDL